MMLYVIVNEKHQLLYQFVFDSKESAEKIVKRYREKYPKNECYIKPLVAVA